MDKVRIFIFSHREIPDVFPRKNYYKYVQCNAVSKKLDGFDIYDDQDNSISDLNWCFSECTGINRVVQDAGLTEGCGYIGFGHYRRYIEFNELDLAENRIICCRQYVKPSVLMQYFMCHNADVVAQFMNRMFLYDNSMFNGIYQYMTASDVLYRCNCFIASKNVFEEYRRFIARILPVMEQIVRSGCIDISGYSDYQKRYIGFLFERMTSYYIYSMTKRGISTLNAPLVDLNVENRENGII